MSNTTRRDLLTDALTAHIEAGDPDDQHASPTITNYLAAMVIDLVDGPAYRAEYTRAEAHALLSRALQARAEHAQSNPTGD